MERITVKMAKEANARREKIISLNRSRRMRGLQTEPVPDKVIPDRIPAAFSPEGVYEGVLSDLDECPTGYHVEWIDPIY